MKLISNLFNKPAPKWICKFINNWFARDLVKTANQCEYHGEIKTAEILHRLATKYKDLDE